MSEHLSDSDTKTEVCLKHLLETHFFFLHQNLLYLQQRGIVTTVKQKGQDLV